MCVGQTQVARLPRHNAVISTFPPPRQVANDSTHRVAKTGKGCVSLPRPFHPDLLFALGVISIDGVYLAYTA